MSDELSLEAIASGTDGRRCAFCKFWTGRQLRGKCRRISVDENGYTLAGKDRERREGENAVARVISIELPASLLTKAEFGCVLWEPPDNEGDAA